MEIVKNGGSVFIFPEGTRSKDGHMGTFKVRPTLEPFWAAYHNLEFAYFIANLTSHLFSVERSIQHCCQNRCTCGSHNSCWNREDNADWIGGYIKPWFG